MSVMLILVATPIFAIEINGSTLIYNNSLEIQVTDLLASSPFIFVDVPTTLRYKFYYNTTELIMDTATITIDGNTYNLTYDIFDQQYKINILFATNETGNYPYSINGTLSGFSNASRSGEYRVRDYVSVSFQIYTELNKSTLYDGGFDHIIAIPGNLSETDIYMDASAPFVYIDDWADQKLGIQGDRRLFQSSQRVFFADYEKEGTSLYLPSNETYTFRLVSGNHEFGSDYYGYMYHTKEHFRTTLISDYVSENKNYELYVSKWEVSFVENLIFWLVWITIVILIFALPIIIYMQTGNPEILAKTIIGAITILPLLGFFITGIVAWIY